MYRTTAVGLALEETLRGMREPTEHRQGLSDAQCAVVWRAFEQSMQEALAAVPVKRRVDVTTAAAQAASEGKAPDRKRRRDGDDSDGDEADDGAAGAGRFAEPLYRSVDGVWTLLLRDAVLECDAPGLPKAFTAATLQIEGRDPTAQRRGRKSAAKKK